MKRYVEEGIGWIVLSRPERLNALSVEVLEELRRALEEADASPEVKVIVLTGEGRFFSAGADLSEVAKAKRPEEAEAPFRAIAALVETMLSLNKPLILALNGDAYGGGAEMIWGADIVIAVENAKLVWAEARWGYNTPLLPAYGLWTLGPSRAALLAMTSEPLSAKEAHSLGLVARLAPSQEALAEEARKIARSIMENSPRAIASIKALIRLAKASPIAFAGLSELQRLAKGSEAREAATAFVEKRKPTYSW